MIEHTMATLAAWWETVPPEFAFLLALPVLVAAAGFAGEYWRRRPRRAQH